VIFTRRSDDASRSALGPYGAEIEGQPPGDAPLDLQAVCARLAALEFNEVLVETGPALAGALLDAGLVDELVIYLAPMLLGAHARSAFETRALTDLNDAKRFQCLDTRSVGSDLRLRLAPVLA
jgi:diaminohydroxyphosphoribosylaminopyrimidine deaminase/5-amino-6-(5-phosphoribosylamino)uracil reductase